MHVPQVLPVSEDTRGHGSHTVAALWQDELEALLERTAGAKGAGGAGPKL